MIEGQSIFSNYLGKLKSVILDSGQAAAGKKVQGENSDLFQRLLSAVESGVKGESGTGRSGMTLADYRSRPVPITYYQIPQMPEKENESSNASTIAGNALEQRMSVDMLRLKKGIENYQRQSIEEQAPAVAENSAPEIEKETLLVKTSRNPRQRIDKAIHRAAKKYDLPPALIHGVIRAESSFKADAVSPAGAQGLMQLMPGTAKELGVSDPFDIEQNVDGGAKYLKKMLGLFDGDTRLALAAYNAGPGTVRRYNGDVPYSETKKYVERVLKYSEQVA